jgi:hypothetical protein
MHWTASSHEAHKKRADRKPPRRELSCSVAADAQPHSFLSIDLVPGHHIAVKLNPVSRQAVESLLGIEGTNLDLVADPHPFMLEAVDSTGQVLATSAAPLTLGEDNLNGFS